MSFVLDAILAGKVNPTNVFDIIAHVVKAVKGDQDAALVVLQDLAKGPDGVLGTSDDIPQGVIDTLKNMLDSGVADQAVAHLAPQSRSKCCFFS